MTFLEFLEIKKDTLDREWPNQYQDAKSDLLYHAFKAVTQEQGRNVLLSILSTTKTAPTVQAITKRLRDHDFRPPSNIEPLPFCNSCNETGTIFVSHEEEVLAMRCNDCEKYNYFDLPIYTPKLTKVCNPYNGAPKDSMKESAKSYRAHMRYSSEFWRTKKQHVQKDEVQQQESPV